MYQILVVVAAVAAYYIFRRYTPNSRDQIEDQHPQEVPRNSDVTPTGAETASDDDQATISKVIIVDTLFTAETLEQQISPIVVEDSIDTPTKRGVVSDDNKAQDEDTPKEFWDATPTTTAKKTDHSPQTPLDFDSSPKPDDATGLTSAQGDNDNAEDASSRIRIRYGLYEIQGKRKEMEDAHHAEISENSRRAFFGVFDGHGGRRAADFAAENLHKILMTHPELQNNPQEAMRFAFTKTEADFMDLAYKDQLEDGSTAVIALVLGTQLFIGNIGDSEAILCRNGKAVCLSTLHNPSKNPLEISRVQEAGGRLYYNRVGHPVINPMLFNIAVSRAIGDIMYKHEEWTSGKKSGLIAEPDIKVFQITPEDSFLILACDGLWDVFSYQSAVDFVKERLKETNDPQKIAEDIVQESERRDTTDNVTVCIVFFDRN